jgi:hypothetical protein
MISKSLELRLFMAIITFVLLAWSFPMMIGSKPNRATIGVGVICAVIFFIGATLLTR